METETPMLRQYNQIKSQYDNCILFFRLGDFYEMFYDDAKVASPILDVVLTSRGSDTTNKIPMCGIPFHAADTYISRLIRAGHRVAICEQVEDPAKAKGIVKRDVVRVITSGTYIDETNSDLRYLISLNIAKNSYGLSFIESTSGTIQTNQYKNADDLISVISKLPVYECVFPQSLEQDVKKLFSYPLLRAKTVTFSPYDDWCFNSDIARKNLLEHFGVHNLSGFDIDDLELAVSSTGALLEYIKEMHNTALKHVDRISLYTDSDFMYISPAACYGLELDELCKTIDRTKTAMGKRRLRNWVYTPLKDAAKIQTRQDAVMVLKENHRLREELERILSHAPDIEKSITKLSCGLGAAKDLLALRNTLMLIPEIKKAISSFVENNILFVVRDIPELRELVEKSISPDAPLTNSEGKIIRAGFNKELDELRDIQENGKEWLRKLQEQEIKRTGINSLKVGFNNVFGYYIIISKPNLHLVPQDYIRKQTLVNAERFVTPELKEFEEKMLNATDNVIRIEKQLLNLIQKNILDQSGPLHMFASSLANIDALVSLANLALQEGYTLPRVTDDTEIIIKDGRHPVVEKKVQTSFVANDTELDDHSSHMLMITGPNMAGKSTYIRQSAILVVLAQIGSYIPAREAKIGIVDKLFTRIGAHDDISKGQSTFMVEMTETAGILNNLSPKSLVILDEVGRGTSTYDGLSLAWAVAEYLIKQKTRTLFATHFHELTGLAEENTGVKNFNVSVKEWKDEIIFLHKIIPGGCDDSYGIYVAKLAGVPKEVLKRGAEILTQLEISGSLQDKIKAPKKSRNVQLTLFGPPSTMDKDALKIKQEISSIDLDELKPLDALNKINEWKRLLDSHE